MQHHIATAFLTLALTATFAHAQAPAAIPNGLSLTEAVGASLPEGNNTQAVTGKGATLFLDVTGGAHHLHDRLAPNFSLLLSFNNLTQRVLTEGQEPSGDSVFLAFEFGPSFTLYRRGRFTATALGGGGLSMKVVDLINPNFSCDNGPDNSNTACIVASSTHWQPSVDGGVTFGWKLHPEGRFEFVQQDRILHMFTPQTSFPGFDTAGSTPFSTSLGVRFTFGGAPIE